MKKLIPLILLTALVGCAEYSSSKECQVKEYAKLNYEPTGNQEVQIMRYCLDF
jgi:hypothetical protein